MEIVTKEYLLSKIGQQAIMEYYLGVPVRQGIHFKSPLRADENPTCSLKWIGNTLLFRDWSHTEAMDCFSVVKYMYGVDFNSALFIVARDFGLITSLPFSNPSKRVSIYSIRMPEHKYSDKSIIQVKLKPYTQGDTKYFSNFGITEQTLTRYQVHSLQQLWLNGKIFWTYSERDPAVGYYFGQNESGEQRWKIYFYRRIKNRYPPKFICNTNRISGWDQIPDKGKLLIQTKSHKDVMALWELGYHGISMQNETTVLYPDLASELNSRFDTILSFYDFDLTGVRMANFLKKHYGFLPVFLTNGRFGSIDYKAKDVSDFIKLIGKSKAKEKVDEFLEKVCFSV